MSSNEYLLESATIIATFPVFLYRFEFKEVDLEQPCILAGETFDVSDCSFRVVAGKAHCGYVLYKAVVGIVAEFCEKGGQGISAREELNIFAGEFKVIFQHVPTSAFKEYINQAVVLSGMQA